jgi:hypothetical protein
MKARVELRGTQLLCRSEEPQIEGVRQVGGPVVERWRKWAGDYNAALRKKDQTTLPALGREIFVWLDGDDRWLTQSLEGVGAIYLEIAAAASPDVTSRAFLDIPWELLPSMRAHTPGFWSTAWANSASQALRPASPIAWDITGRSWFLRITAQSRSSTPSPRRFPAKFDQI